MPIYEPEIKYADMKRIVEDGHVCGECGGRLNIAFIGGKNVLRCANLEHHTITMHDYKNEERIRQHKMDSTALTKLTENQMLARVSMGGKFVDDLNPVEKRKLASLARFYGFDPAMGEMTIYQGRPYVSIDGRYRKAQETGKFNGVESRPATKEEYESQRIPPEDYLWRADVHVKGAAYPFVGWGRVFAGETMGGKGFKPVEKNPQRMAEKRAEAQALRKAFHIELPSIEEVGTPDDPNIIESTARVVEPPIASDIAQDAQEKPPAVNRDVTLIKTSTDLYKAVCADWPTSFKSSKDVNKELGINSWTDSSETPAQAYERIASVRK